MKKLIALTLSIASFSAFAFTADMTSVEVATEVKTLVANGKTPKAIDALAKDAGVDSNQVVGALIAAGVDPTDVLAATASGQSNSFTGSTSSFGQSRASTVGGGGRASVSKS